MTSQYRRESKLWPGFLAGLRRHWLFIGMLGVYMLITTWFVFQVSPLAAPNEWLHYEYVALLRQTGQLPDPATSKRMDERHQPPVYYALTALLSSPFPTPPLDTELEQNPYFLATHEGNHSKYAGLTLATLPVLYVGRFVSMFLGTLALIVLYAAACLVFQRETALLIAALMGFQPMFLFLSAALSNDLAVTAASAIVLAWTTLMIVRGWGERAYLIWGVLFAIALLTKASAVFLVVVLPIACWARWNSRGHFWRAVRGGLVAGLGFAPFYLSWIFFNLHRNLDAAAVSASVPTLARIVSVIPHDLPLILPYLDRLWRTFLLDWSTAETGFVFNEYYAISALAMIIALAGWLRRPYRLRQDGVLPLMHIAWVLPLWLVFLATKTLMVKEAGFLAPEGRWLLPTLPSLAWLMAGGWLRWWPVKWQRSVALGSMAAIVTSSMLLVFLYLPRFYPSGARRIAQPGEIPADVQPVGIVCNGQLKLIGVHSTPLIANRRAEVDFYWQALQSIDTNYGMSAVLVVPDPSGWKQLDSQRSYPGNGATVTRGWQAGDIYQDRMVFYPHGDLAGPTTALITVGLLNGKIGVPCTLDGAPLDVAVAQEVVVRPGSVVTPADRLSSPVSFGGAFDLIGVTPVVTPDGLQVTLWWQARVETSTKYTVFIHLLDQQGQIITQSDSPPAQGLSPTTIWQAGDIVRDTYRLSAQMPLSGALSIGMYDPATLERLRATQNGQPLTNNAFQFSVP